jgi:predicted NBD/HSP70 family sugar kinase
MIGLELEDARAVAVRITAEGAIDVRAEEHANGDLARAADRAIDAVVAPSTDARVIGVAAAAPDAPAIASIVATLAPRLGGAEHRVVAAGIAAAVAEAWIGAGRGVGDVAYFSVAAHATAGLVRDGAAVTGHHGRAASVAWLALNPVEREDYRRTGCLEAEVAAAGIVRRLIWRIKAGDRSRVEEQVNHDLSAITIDQILHAARDGDGVSISVMRDTAKYLGMAAANLVVVTDPEMLVLGGIMATAADLMLELVRTEIARRLPRSMFEALRIVPATLGTDAAAIGAARLAAPALQ